MCPSNVSWLTDCYKWTKTVKLTSPSKQNLIKYMYYRSPFMRGKGLKYYHYDLSLQSYYYSNYRYLGLHSIQARRDLLVISSSNHAISLDIKMIWLSEYSSINWERCIKKKNTTHAFKQDTRKVMNKLHYGNYAG